MCECWSCWSLLLARAVLAKGLNPVAKVLGEPHIELLLDGIKLDGNDIYLSMWYKPNYCVLTVLLCSYFWGDFITLFGKNSLELTYSLYFFSLYSVCSLLSFGKPCILWYKLSLLYRALKGQANGDVDLVVWSWPPGSLLWFTEVRTYMVIFGSLLLVYLLKSGMPLKVFRSVRWN